MGKADLDLALLAADCNAATAATAAEEEEEEEVDEGEEKKTPHLTHTHTYTHTCAPAKCLLTFHRFATSAGGQTVSIEAGIDGLAAAARQLPVCLANTLLLLQTAADAQAAQAGRVATAGWRP